MAYFLEGFFIIGFGLLTCWVSILMFLEAFSEHKTIKARSTAMLNAIKPYFYMGLLAILSNMFLKEFL